MRSVVAIWILGWSYCWHFLLGRLDRLQNRVWLLFKHLVRILALNFLRVEILNIPWMKLSCFLAILNLKFLKKIAFLLYQIIIFKYLLPVIVLFESLKRNFLQNFINYFTFFTIFTAWWVRFSILNCKRPACPQLASILVFPTNN